MSSADLTPATFAADFKVGGVFFRSRNETMRFLMIQPHPVHNELLVLATARQEAENQCMGG